jgi:hypothetical protein
MGQAPTSVQQGAQAAVSWAHNASMDAANVGFHIRSAAVANGPSPDALAHPHLHPDAAYGAGGPAGVGQGGAASGHLILPHPPAHGTASRQGISRHGSGGPAAYVAGGYVSGASSPAPGADLTAPAGAASGISRTASPAPGGTGGGHLATGVAFNRTPTHSAAMTVGGEAVAMAGARTMAAAGQGALAHGGAILLNSSGRPLHAQGSQHQAVASTGGAGAGMPPRHASFGPDQTAAEAAGGEAPEAAALEAAAVEGASLQVALAVLRTGSVKPSVARRLYPLGRPRVMDIPVPGYFGVSENDPAVGPLSFPLEDLSSSSSSSDEDEDARSWATVSEGGGEAAAATPYGRPALAAAGAGTGMTLQSRDAAAAVSRSGGLSTAETATAAAAGGRPGSRMGGAAAVPVTTAAAGEVHLQQSTRAARAVLSTAAAPHPGANAGVGPVAATGRAVPPQLGVAGTAPAAETAGKQAHAAGAAPVQASHQRVTVKAGMHRASPAPPLPHSTSSASTSVPPSRATTAAAPAAALGAGSFAGNASGMRRDPVGGASSLSSFQTRPETALSSAWDDDPNLAPGPPATPPPPDDEPLYDDSEELRQFDMLYDMTRWTVAPPPTPRGYRCVHASHAGLTWLGGLLLQGKAGLTSGATSKAPLLTGEELQVSGCLHTMSSGLTHSLMLPRLAGGPATGPRTITSQ